MKNNLDLIEYDSDDEDDNLRESLTLFNNKEVFLSILQGREPKTLSKKEFLKNRI